MGKKIIEIKRYISQIVKANSNNLRIDAFELYRDLWKILREKPTKKLIIEVFDKLSSDFKVTITSKEKLFQTKYRKDNIHIKDETDNDVLLKLYKETGDIKYRNALIERNQRLVWSIARTRFGWSSTFDLDDLFQEGIVGLMKGIEKFKIEYDVEFSTYVVYWIMQAIDRAIYDKGHLIRLPVYLAEKMNKVRKLEEKSISNDMTLDIKRICEESGISEEKYLEIKEHERNFRNLVSLDLPIGEEEETELGELLSNKNTQQIYNEDMDVEEIVVKRELKDEIESILNKVTLRERVILEQRFGWGGRKPKTLAEIGKTLGLTRERIRQIQEQTLKRFSSNPKIVKRLSVFLE